jgi:hypothetical protein
VFDNVGAGTIGPATVDGFLAVLAFVWDDDGAAAMWAVYSSQMWSVCLTLTPLPPIWTHGTTEPASVLCVVSSEQCRYRGSESVTTGTTDCVHQCLKAVLLG